MNIAFMFLQSIFAFKPFSTALCFTYEPGITFTRLLMLFKTVQMNDRLKQDKEVHWNGSILWNKCRIVHWPVQCMSPGLWAEGIVAKGALVSFWVTWWIKWLRTVQNTKERIKIKQIKHHIRMSQNKGIFNIWIKSVDLQSEQSH